jgi:hypothetical protein
VPDLQQPESVGDAFFVVEMQEHGRRSPARGYSLDQGAVETKVALPASTRSRTWRRTRSGMDVAMVLRRLLPQLAMRFQLDKLHLMR